MSEPIPGPTDEQETAVAPVRYESAEQLLDERDFDMVISTYRFEGSLNGRHVFPPDESVDDEIEIDFAVRHQANLVGLRMTASVEHEYGSALVDVGVNYVFDAEIVLAPEALDEFINRVAVLALYPYLREAFASLTQRVFGKPTTLAVLKQRDVGIAPAAQDDASGSEED